MAQKKEEKMGELHVIQATAANCVQLWTKYEGNV